MGDVTEKEMCNLCFEKFCCERNKEIGSSRKSLWNLRGIFKDGR